ncbi:hypothetical protein [Undibacterium sp. TJN19]|uniref:hypothetical protein n=1 Tax=Undibacterium sp. TJN19 TaxID=3413055 RepID=UPI003BEFE62E
MHVHLFKNEIALAKFISSLEDASGLPDDGNALVCLVDGTQPVIDDHAHPAIHGVWSDKFIPRACCAQKISGTAHQKKTVFTVKMTRMNCGWVCHACVAENSQQLQQCHACGCAAFASVQQMEKYTVVKRKSDFNLSREWAVSVLFWVVVASIALFLRFII